MHGMMDAELEDRRGRLQQAKMDKKFLAKKRTDNENLFNSLLY